MKLFDDDFEVDESPEDNTQITTTLLYYSEEELKEFKRQCKEGIRKMFGTEAITKGNLSDFLLRVTKQYNETNNSQEISKSESSGSIIS